MATEVYFPTDKTPEQWREMARGRRQDSIDSFERCDTDGFMSQWASDTMSGLYALCASIAEDGGKREFRWLFTIDGQPVPEGQWRIVQTKYGSSVAVGEFGHTVWFNESRAQSPAKRLIADRRKGFVWGTVRCDAVVMMGGGGTGMAGALSVRPIAKPKRGAELDVVETVRAQDYSREDVDA